VVDNTNRQVISFSRTCPATSPCVSLGRSNRIDRAIREALVPGRYKRCRQPFRMSSPYAVFLGFIGGGAAEH